MEENLPNDPTPAQMLVIILGASVFPRAPKLAAGKAFYTSASDFKDYVISTDGLRVPAENVQWLFDDNRGAGDQLRDLADFLQTKSRNANTDNSPVRDLLIYYVGHGLFSRGDHAYCLAIRSTSESAEGFSSIRMSDLAGLIKDNAAFMRRFLVLDCCFAGSAYKSFQTSPLAAAEVQIVKELPRKGTALLCSSNSNDASRAPEGMERTMFSNALLNTLRRGHPSLGPKMSMSEVGELVREYLMQAHDDWVRPEVLSPDQQDGDIANIPLFANRSYAPRRMSVSKVRQIISGFPDIRSERE